MKDMLYEFIAIAVVALLIGTYVIGHGDNSLQGNMDTLAKNNTAIVKNISK